MAQQQDETVAQFVTKLRSQAQLCNFKDTDDQIRDQLFQAMIDGELREKLLEITNLTLAEALDTLRQRETATAQAMSMSTSSVGLPCSVHRVYERRQQPSVAAQSQAPPSTSTRVSNSTRSPPPRPSQHVSGTCYACCMQGHFAKTPSCPVRGKRCTCCNFKGPTASVCRKKAAALNELKVELAGGDDRAPEARVAEDASYSLQLNNVAAVRVRGVGEKPIFLDVLIKDQDLEMKLDTGARFQNNSGKLRGRKFNCSTQTFV